MFPFILVGAILRWACPASVDGIELHLIGDWLLWIGGITTALVIALYVAAAVFAVKSR